MAEVAAEAGISQGLAYRYFPSKDALFLRLLSETVTTSDEVAAHVRGMPGTPGEKLRQIISTMLERRQKIPEFYQLMSRATADEKLPKDLREVVMKQGVTARTLLRQLIVEAQKKREVAQDDPDQMLNAILACLEGLSRVSQFSPEEVEKHMPDARIILRILGAEPK